MVRLQKGDFMATILDIAEKLGVSKGTVSKALNGAPDISETLRKTILETAVEMGYTRRRRQKQTAKKLCILVENLDYEEPHQFGYDIVTGFRQMAEPAGFLVEIFPITEKLQRSISYDMFMLQHDYLGAFALGFTLQDPWMTDFQTSSTPTVLYDNYIKTNPRTAYVGVDNNEGMELAVSHLKELGHKKALCLADNFICMDKERIEGFRKAFEHGETYRWEIPKTEKERMRFYEDNYMQLLKSNVTAVFAVSDFYALDFMKFLQGKNIRIPEDIQIIGFDDNMASRESNPSLTTIHQEANLRAKAAIECLEAMRDGAEYKTEIVLPVDLIQRESTRKL